MFRMFEREVVKADQVRTIYKSQTFPTTGYGHAHNLDPELAAKIKQAFFTFEWKGSALEEEFVAEDKFVAIYHKSDRDINRKIDKANGFTYDSKQRPFAAPHGKVRTGDAGRARFHYATL